MRGIHGRWLASWLAAGVWLAVSAAVSAAAQAPAAGAAALQAQFGALAGRPGLGGLPLHVQASELEGVVSGEVQAVFARGFDEMIGLLRSGGQWCEVVVLHPNVKACTHEPSGERERIVFYTGYKYYQPARLSRRHQYYLHVERHEPGYLLARLWPEPDKLMAGAEPAVIEVVALGRDRAGLRVYYHQRLSTWARLAAKAYFATLGRDKPGFTVLGHDADGKPVHVHGLVGAIERNIVRYFLAIQTHLDAHDTAPDDEHRFSHWFALTERYALQLHEMEKDSYLETKRKERAQQRLLQRELNTSVP
jgi:hypothetical protein